MKGIVTLQDDKPIRVSSGDQYWDNKYTVVALLIFFFKVKGY